MTGPASPWIKWIRIWEHVKYHISSFLPISEFFKNAFVSLLKTPNLLQFKFLLKTKESRQDSLESHNKLHAIHYMLAAIVHLKNL